MRKYMVKYDMALISEKDAANYPTEKIVAIERSDINSDGSVDILDLLMLRKHLLKIDVFYGIYENE